MEIEKIQFHKVDIGVKPDPSLANPKVEVVKHEDVVNLHFEIENKNLLTKLAKIEFRNCLMYRVGSPNDEGFYSFFYKPEIINESIYSKKNFPELEFDEFYLVEGYDWVKHQLGQGTICLKDIPSNINEYKHYVFFMKDGTFECVARDFKKVIPN